MRLLTLLFLTPVVLSAIPSVYAGTSASPGYKSSGGCGSICFGECEDFSNKPMPKANCAHVDPSTPALCKALYGECARLEDSKCAWKPNLEFNECLKAPKNYEGQYKVLQESRFTKSPAPVPVVSVPDAFKTCASDSDCVQITEACRYCCDVDAINIHRQADYNKFVGSRCGSPNPVLCGCLAPEYAAVCLEKTCKLERKLRQ